MKHARLFRTLVSALALAMLLVACGSDDDGSDAEQTAEPTATDTTPDDPATTDGAAPAETYDVHIASASSSLTAGLVLSAMTLDTYGDHGITTEYTDFAGSSSNPIAALLGGEAEVAFVGTATALNAMAEGAPLVVIASVAGNTSELGVATSVIDELDATAESTTEERVQALKGRTIATAAAGSSNAQMLEAVLEIYGLDPASDVTIVPSEPTAIISGLKEGLYDAAFYGIGVMETNYSDGSAEPWVVLPAGDVPELEDMVFASAVTTQDIIDANPGMAEAFHAALQDAGAAIDEDSGGVAAQVKSEWFPDMEQGVFDLSWQLTSQAYPRDASLSAEQWEFTTSFVNETAEKDLTTLGFEEYVADFARR